jgi:chemotaxis protein histidine kinase CheA
MKLSQTEIEARLAEVRLSYITSLADKRESVVRLWDTLCTQWQQETYQALYLIIHSLAGSAETFGLSNITRDARKVINLFKQHTERGMPDDDRLPAITVGIDQLVTSITSALLEIKKRGE